jgi:transcriptional regulator with XRE-family HTH domain
MAAMRCRRGLSVRRLARQAGLSHDAVGAWERGERLPRLPELEAALTALGVEPAERLRLIALVSAPRALRHVRASGAVEAVGGVTAVRGVTVAVPGLSKAGPMPGGGDLLRAMRGRRGLTQAQAAQAAGISQGRLAHWERSEEWPAVGRLHRLCSALGASAGETAALIGGQGALPGWDEGEDAEAWSCQGGTASPDDPLGLLIRRTYFQADALRDLRSLSLERALWLRARDSEAFRSHLHDACAYRARAMMEEGRFGEIGVYADRTWDLARQGYGRSQFWAWGVIASASVLCHGFERRRPRPDAAAALLVGAVAEAAPDENQAWLLGEIALTLAGAGRADEAVRASLQARAVAETMPDPAEGWFRRRDHAVVLATLGRYGEALDVLETAAGLSRFGSDPIIRHHLLAAACHLGLGNTGAAQENLTPALVLIEQHTEGDGVHLARLRLQADALLARL